MGGDSVTYATSEWRPGDRQGSGLYSARDLSAHEQAQATEIGWVSIRNAALARLRRMVSGHVSLAVNPPRGRLPGPHALAFLYTWHAETSTPQVPVYQVGAATRVFDDNEDTRPGHNVRDLRLLLSGLREVAIDRIGEGGFDPRISMADRADQMPSRPTFVGLGVSSLGGPEEWLKARSRALAGTGLAELNLPAAWRIRLIDGTRIEVSRTPGLLQEQVRSSGPLVVPGGGGVVGYMTNWSRLPDNYAPEPGSVDYWLDGLCLTIDDGIRHSGPAHRRR
jgi:hypothetical protein